MNTIEHIFMNIIQASKILEMYDMHEKVLTNFVQMNQKNEGQEHMSLGWIETFDKHIEVRIKMTKRDCNHIQQRIEICRTKVQILENCNENEKIGKYMIIIY